MFVGVGIFGYGVAAGLSLVIGGPRPHRDYAILGGLGVAVLALGAAIAWRWSALGQGPFMTLYEVLLSNLFSLGLVYLISFWRWPAVRPGAVVALPFLLVLGIWLLLEPAEPVPLPPTFDSPWLWAHVLCGKLFLGTALVAVGLAAVLLLGQRLATPSTLFGGWPVERLDATVWRFLSAAFVLDSLMLVAGAVWAHHAWGRYWAWDPLETWAFLTWLTLGLTLHLRVTYRLPRWLGWSLAIGVFALAFVTFFGVPFLSLAPHKGVM
jgi:ABC-type transport system involved in cytochrome c biogenesis permease subunit